MRIGILKYILVLIALGLTLYVPALSNKFVWDDEEQVVANEAVHSLSNMPQIFAGSTFNSGGSLRLGGLYYKPLMSATFAVLYTFFGPTPWAFHLLQIVLHLMIVMMLFLILRQLWKNDMVAMFVSMVFLIHPQNVETVVYISSLQDVLYMFFGMLGLTWMVISENKLQWYDFVFVGLCVLLAMLGKETGGLFLIIIASYLWLFKSKKYLWYWILTSCLVFFFYLYLRVGVAHVGLDKNVFTPMATLPLLTRLGNVPAIIWHYLSQFVWPDNLSISQHWVNRSPGVWSYVYLSVMFGGWIAGLRYAWKKLGRSFVFFWLWTGMALAFHSQIFPLDMTVADRWFYLPMIGILGSVGTIVAKFRPPASRQGGLASARIGTVGAGIILILLFARSSVRIQNWRDGLTLYKHDQQIMQNSFDLENNLGVELYRSGDMKHAKDHFARSTEISPTWWTNWNNLGVIIENEGDLDTALSYYKKAMDNGNYYLAYGNYARVLIKQNKLAEARIFIQNSLKLYPTNTTLLDLSSHLSILERTNKPAKK